jgi:uncharacterized protein (DUF433 family)
MNLEVLLGKPVIQGTRMPVYLIVDLVEAGLTPAEIVDDYPELTEVDIAAAVEFAAQEKDRTETRVL